MANVSFYWYSGSQHKNLKKGFPGGGHRFGLKSQTFLEYERVTPFSEYLA